MVLLPRAVEEYKRTLAGLLEGERYGEAVRLLAFLLQCGGAAEQWHGEWRELKELLEALALPGTGDATETEAAGAGRATERAAHGPETGAVGKASQAEAAWPSGDGEEAWLRGIVTARSAADEAYAERLLAVLEKSGDPERQLAALGTLRHLDHPAVIPALRAWLAGREHHPLVRFRTLQALKALGAKGRVELRCDGGVFAVALEEVPLRPEDFPPAIRKVRERVRAEAEAADPVLAVFAEELWLECVQAAYGTGVYAEMAQGDESAVRAWAAALHRLVAERLHGTADDAAILEQYAIATDDLRGRYERSLRWLRRYAGRGTRGTT